MSKVSYLFIFLFYFSTHSLVRGGDVPPDCPHGELSARFCDRDGDMQADPEQDPGKWLNPYTLVFGYTPTQKLYEGAQKALKGHIEEATGKRVRFFLYRTNAAELEAMRVGMLHIASLNTGSVPIGVNCTGYRLFAMTTKADKSYGYTMQIITYPGSGINTIKDIKDMIILFVTPTSNSGYKAPRALLESKYNYVEGIDYFSRFSGSHTRSILSVASKKVKIAAIANGVLFSMIASGKIKKGSVKVIYTSGLFPAAGFGYPYNLKPSLAKKIEQALLSFKWVDENGKPKDINKYHDIGFIPADYADKWSQVRELNKVGKKFHSSSCR